MQGLNVTKPGGNRAPSETVLGSTHLEQVQMHDHQVISTPHDVQLISEAAKLAAIDALLYVIERTPTGFRSLRRDEIVCEYWTNSWAEYVVDLAIFNGVDALLANKGLFLITERVMVCNEDELRRPASQVEPGWQRVKLCSIDGKARAHDREAPQILISPDAQCFLWQPEGGPKNQKRLTFMELLAKLGDMGERLARFEVAV